MESKGKEKAQDSVGPNLSKMTPRERKFYELQLKFRSSAVKTKREVIKEHYRNKTKSSKNEKSPSDLKIEKVSQKGNSGGKKTARNRSATKGSINALNAQKVYEKRAKKNPQNNIEDRTFDAYFRKIEQLDHCNLPIADEDSLVNVDSVEVLQNVKTRREDVDSEKKKREFSRRRKYNEERDITFINRRNEMFNAKVDRAYGKYTSEVRGNLERGTAL